MRRCAELVLKKFSSLHTEDANPGLATLLTEPPEASYTRLDAAVATDGPSLASRSHVKHQQTIDQCNTTRI
jgi:hypothetical protein